MDLSGRRTIFPSGGSGAYGTAADPTVAYTYSDPVDMADHVRASCLITASGTAPASFEAMIEVCQDTNLADWRPLQLVAEQAAGAAPWRGTIFSLEDSDGTVLSAAGPHAGRAPPIDIERSGAWRFWRLAIKRTGGAATDLIEAGRVLGA